MAPKKNILIIDDHPLVREGLTSILKSAAEYEVIGQAGNARDGIRMVEDLKPDLVLLDLGLPDKSGLVGMMPASLGDSQVMGLKAISVFPGNHSTDYDFHQGTVMLFETRNGRLLAVMEAGNITAIRTAAVSGVATGLLARKNAAELAILGSGVQARSHLEAMGVARNIAGVRV